MIPTWGPNGYDVLWTYDPQSKLLGGDTGSYKTSSKDIGLRVALGGAVVHMSSAGPRFGAADYAQAAARGAKVPCLSLGMRAWGLGFFGVRV